MLSYAAVKLLHMSCAAISVSLFVWRGQRALRELPPWQSSWLRALPHVIDTIFLGSAIALTLMIHQYPFINGWLTAKLLGLVAYIVLGSLALKRARTSPVRTVAFFAALCVFAYIVGVAVTHDPRSWLAYA